METIDYVALKDLEDKRYQVGLLERLRIHDINIISGQKTRVLMVNSYYAGVGAKRLKVDEHVWNPDGEYDESGYRDSERFPTIFAHNETAYEPYPEHYIPALRQEVEDFAKRCEGRKVILTIASGLHGWGLREDYRVWLASEAKDLLQRASEGLVTLNTIFDDFQSGTR